MTTREKIDNLYASRKEIEEEINQIQSQCIHENRAESKYQLMTPHVFVKMICVDCDANAGFERRLDHTNEPVN